MIKDIAKRLGSLNPWHFLWVAVLLSEIFTLIMTSLQSYPIWGFVPGTVLRIGAIDALFVPLVVAPIIIFFIAKTEEITKANERLLREIALRGEVEKELRETETFTESALNALQEIFFVFDAEGKFLRWNEAVRTVTGYDDTEISSMRPVDFFPEGEQSRVTEAIDAAIRTGHVRLETQVFTKDGRRIPFLFTGSLLRDRDGRTLGISGTGIDISAHKRAEGLLQESEVKFQDMAERSMAGIYLIQGGIFRYVNPMLAEIFGYTVEELTDRKGPEHLVLPQDWPLVRDNLEKRIAGEMGSVHYSFRGIRKDKGTIYVEVFGSKTIYKSQPAVIGTLIDVTERTVAQDRISRQLQRLSSLRSIDLAISASLDLRVTLKVFLDHVASQLRIDAANVFLISPRGGMLEFAASHGFRRRPSGNLKIHLGRGFAGVAALENRIVKIPNLKEEGGGRSLPDLFEGEGFVTYYGVPLVARGRVNGVLEIFQRSPLEFDEELSEFLSSLALQAAIAIDNTLLFADLRQSSMELSVAYDSTIEGWSRALDYRDKETEGHSQRVTDLTVKIGREMGMSEDELVHMRRGALLHDIGKMGIPDSILLKPGPLTEEEWEIMKQHPVYSYKILHPIAYLMPALAIPYCHHEKWDGSGYPRGLKGGGIPLAARIFALVDVWDALRSDRPYRPAWPEGKTKEHIRSLSGGHFDPEVVEVFFKIQNTNIGP